MVIRHIIWFTLITFNHSDNILQLVPELPEHLLFSIWSCHSSAKVASGLHSSLISIYTNHFAFAKAIAFLLLNLIMESLWRFIWRGSCLVGFQWEINGSILSPALWWSVWRCSTLSCHVSPHKPIASMSGWMYEKRATQIKWKCSYHLNFLACIILQPQVSIWLKLYVAD